MLDWPDILHVSSKIIRFLDVSGQEKYSKSMVKIIKNLFICLLLKYSFQQYAVNILIML